MTSQSLINRDGSGLRRFVPAGIAANWSTDGRWIYYSRNKDDTRCIEKAAIAGGPAISVRCDNAVAPAPTPDGSALYFANYLTTTNGIVDYEIRRARPENGPSERAGPRGRVARAGEPEAVHARPVTEWQVAGDAADGWRHEQRLGVADRWRGRCDRSPTSAIARS